MEVFFFSFFPSLYSKKAVWMSAASSRTSNYRRLELEGSFELARESRQHFAGEEIGARRLGNFLEVTESVPGRLRAGALDF